jgi:hypothetical protein
MNIIFYFLLRLKFCLVEAIHDFCKLQFEENLGRCKKIAIFYVIIICELRFKMC